MRIALSTIGCLALGWSSAASAQGCESPDFFEPNDGCLSPAALSAGSFTGLTVQGSAALGGADLDYYQLTVAPGEALQVDAFFSTAAGDIDLELFDDASCSQLVDASYSLTDDEQVGYVNSGVQPIDLVLVARGYGARFDCNSYDLLVVLGPDPCAGLVPDALEPNDDCQSAALLFGGSTTDLNVSLSNPDWFRLTLDPDQSMALEVQFVHAQGDLDLRLWGGCPITGLVPYATSESASDDEWIGFGNPEEVPLDLWIEVYVWSGSQSACNDYDLLVTLEGGTPATALCFGDGSGGLSCPCGNLGGAGEGCASSVGSGAVLSADGSSVHANDDLVLLVDGARPGQPGMALQGGALTPMLFRDGILCLGPPTERLELLFLDGAGSTATTISIVQEGAVSGPGTTTYYQFWFRDPAFSVCGQGSNLSNALQVDWN